MCIIVSVEGFTATGQPPYGLFSVQFASEPLNELDRLLEFWLNPGLLESYLSVSENMTAMKWYGIQTIPEAVKAIRNQAYLLQDQIFACLDRKVRFRRGLPAIFRPYHGSDNGSVQLNDKAKASVLFADDIYLRLYALRFNDDVYLVTSGCIKLSNNSEGKYAHVDVRAATEKMDKVYNLCFIAKPQVVIEDFQNLPLSLPKQAE